MKNRQQIHLTIQLICLNLKTNTNSKRALCFALYALSVKSGFTLCALCFKPKKIPAKNRRDFIAYDD